MHHRITRAFGMFCAVAVLGTTTASAAFASAPRDTLSHLTGDQILARALHDVRDLRSIHIYSELATSVLTIGTGMTVTQQGCLATESLPGMGTMKVLIIGSNGWMQPDDGFWKAQGFTGSQLAAVSGKWITMPGEALQGLDGCSLKILDSAMPHGWKKGRVARSQGITKLALTFRAKGVRETITVSDSARPLLLADVATITDPKVRLARYYGNFNAPIVLTAPPASDVLTTLPTPPGTGSTSPQARAVSAVSAAVAATLESLRVDGLVAG